MLPGVALLLARGGGDLRDDVGQDLRSLLPADEIEQLVGLRNRVQHVTKVTIVVISTGSAQHRRHLLRRRALGDGRA